MDSPKFSLDHSLIQLSKKKGGWGGVEVCIGPQDAFFRCELPFSIDVRGGENFVGRCVMITGGVLVLPSMPKGDIVDHWLSLMSTQAAPGDTPILHGNFDMIAYSIPSQGYF